MADSNNLLCELERVVDKNPQFHITRVMHNISKVDEYMPDDEAAYVLKKLVDSYSEDENMFSSAEFWDGMYRAYENSDLNLLTKEHEQIAYDKFKKRQEYTVSILLEERLSLYEFMLRFPSSYGPYSKLQACPTKEELAEDAQYEHSIYKLYEDDLNELEQDKKYTIINHSSKFLWEYGKLRHMDYYLAGRVGDKYITIIGYAAKIPDFQELFKSVTLDLYFGSWDERNRAGSIFDEWISLVFDSNETPRAVAYTDRILYGALVRPEKMEIEVYNQDQATEIFHEWMQKSNIIIDNWNGVLYDDGTAEVFEDVKNYIKNR